MQSRRNTLLENEAAIYGQHRDVGSNLTVVNAIVGNSDFQKTSHGHKAVVRHHGSFTVQTAIRSVETVVGETQAVETYYVSLSIFRLIPMKYPFFLETQIFLKRKVKKIVY